LYHFSHALNEARNQPERKMNYAKMYALIEAEMIVSRGSKMPSKAKDAWASACDNAGYAAELDSAMYKAACFDSLPMTSAFEESQEVRTWFESIGFSY
jgi:hypothetical protein